MTLFANFLTEECRRRVRGTVDVHIGGVGCTIESDPSKPRYILTVRGIGCKFVKGEE